MGEAGRTTIALTFTFGRGVPPTDVLVEHLAYTVRNDFKESELMAIRNHPFEGPEVFDDEPQLEEFESPVSAGERVLKKQPDGVESPWPTVDEVIKSLRGEE